MDTNTDNILKSDEKEIDLLELIKVLWKKRKFILKFSCLGLLIGIIIAFSIPKTYTTTMTLAPEKVQGSSSISTIAALTGISISGSNGNVLSSPELFPTILNSTPFITGLFDIRVQNINNTIDTTLYAYIKDYQKGPWWSSIVGIPTKILSLFSRKNEPSNTQLSISHNNSYTTLTSEELSIVSSLTASFSISVDKKTEIITLSVKMQDPKISAYMADTISKYLQDYVINYRTLKSREDLAFAQKLFDETKADYYKKQQELANYTDANIGIISAKYATTKDRLQNEVTLAYNMYNQMAQELQKTKIKVQDTTPVYTIIQPSVEPISPSSPNKKMIIVVSVFVFLLVASIYVLAKDYLMNKKI